MGDSESSGSFNFYKKGYNPDDASVSGYDKNNSILYTNIPASNQFGIYARFA